MRQSCGKRGKAHITFRRKLSLGQSPHCRALLAGPGPIGFLAKGNRGRAATPKGSSFPVKQPPSTLPLTPPGDSSLHPSEILPPSHETGRALLCPSCLGWG